MRLKHLTLLLALPTTFAITFTLSNFQKITASTVPLSCLLAYDAAMDDCSRKDFDDGCSAKCTATLNDIQSNVQDVCSVVNVNPNTLLGIVKNGGIVKALCPTNGGQAPPPPPLVNPSKGTTTSVAATTSRSAAPTQISVTIPTASPGVTVSKTSTSSTVQSTQSTLSRVTSSSADSTSNDDSATETSASSTETTSAATTVTTPSAAPVITTTASSSKKGAVYTSSTSSSETKATSKPDISTGGGSPFDIASTGSGSIVGSTPVWGVLLTILWTGVLFGR